MHMKEGRNIKANLESLCKVPSDKRNGALKDTAMGLQPHFM